MSDNNDKNSLLFENLVNRLLLDEMTGQYSLPGVITADERVALFFAQKLLGQSQSVVTKESVLSSVQDEPQIVPTTVAEVGAVFEVVAEPVAEVPVITGPDSSGIVEKVVSSQGIEGLLDMSVVHQHDFLPHIKLGLDFGLPPIDPLI